MKNLFAILISFIVLITNSAIASETFTLDENHTYVLWRIKHLGFSTQVGKWYATGILILDKNNPKNSKVTATIKVSDMITGLPELDKHLKGKLFFDTEQYPTAAFVSDHVDVKSKNHALVHGMLTVHGITKPVILDVMFNQAGINPISDKMTVGFSATAKIKRSDFGIKTLLPQLSDDVDLNIEAEGYQNKQ
jgi:polyisoprenoid-binding protein YceI